MGSIFFSVEVLQCSDKKFGIYFNVNTKNCKLFGKIHQNFEAKKNVK
jgi:hypothetical protein